MTSISVTVDDRHRPAIDEVAENLRAQGMEVSRVLASIGVITGAAKEARFSALRAVPGVTAVTEDRTITVAPPQDEVQ